MQQERLAYLIEQYSNNAASEEEAAEFARFIRENADPEPFSGIVVSLMERYPAARSEITRFDGLSKMVLQADRVHEQDSGRLPNDTRSLPFLHRLQQASGGWGWAAASIILALGVGAYLWTTSSLSKKRAASAEARSAKVDAVQPGKDGAILTLADGSQVVLDSLGNGVIATQNGSQAIIKNGALSYDLTGEMAGEVVYNTMMTPKGRQFSLLLPDGTRVWLNAASSIRYPTVFAGKERSVEITGEAYFEVTKNTQQPFRVNVNDKAEVDVLGTHFNVNAYDDEATINTTLLEGSVKVNGTAIKPGQQAQVVNKMPGGQARQGVEVVRTADMEKVMAWKNGFIYFDGATFDEIMRQLERWYDIEVVYENNKIPNKRLAGGMTRGVSLNDLLKYLGKMGVHYQLDDRTLIVSP